MPQRLNAIVVVAVLLGMPLGAAAQQTERAARLVPQRASAAAGSIHGVVKDDTGALVAGVSVVAMGTALASVRSDEDGRYNLSLPPGEYILRASRDGYVSTFREPVRIQTSARLQRDITLLREGETAARLMASAGGLQPGPGDLLTPLAPDDQHSHSEIAWRLRHLFRSILRDEAPAGGGIEGGNGAGDFRPKGSFLDRVVLESARAATAYFAQTDFSGQVHLLATGMLEPGGWRPEHWFQGVAYGAVSAPVGTYGDWKVRGAIDAGGLSAWVLLAEYRASSDLRHAFHVGMSFAAQRTGVVSASRQLAGDSRSVGAVFGSDTWHVRPGLELEYGLRVDRYDYVSGPAMASPHVGARVTVLPGTRVVARTSRRAVAPGATEFLPPATSSPWLPPDRTFSPLAAGAAYRAEQVRSFELGLEHDLGTRSTTVAVRRFRQSSADQIATLFGPDAGQGPGHYRVASPGSVDVDGWRVGLWGELAPGMHAAIEYLTGEAAWTPGGEPRALDLLAPSAVRTGAERLHDVTFNVDADLAPTNTRVTMAYRVSSAFSAGTRTESEPGLDTRFDLEVRQGLPYRPLGGSQLELMLAVRNLFRDTREEGSLYDELLTIAPPLRFTGGVRIRF